MMHSHFSRHWQFEAGKIHAHFVIGIDTNHLIIKLNT